MRVIYHKTLFIVLIVLSCMLFISCGGINIETPYDFFESINNKNDKQDNETIINILADTLIIETKDVKLDYSKSEAEFCIKEDVSGKYHLLGKVSRNGFEQYGEISGEYLNGQLHYTNYMEDSFEGKSYNLMHQIVKQKFIPNFELGNLKFGGQDFYEGLITILDKLINDYKTSTFVKETYNKIFNLEETTDQYVISLNYDGIKTYINDLLTKPISEHLEKILDEDEIDYDELIDDISDLSVKEILNSLHEKDINDDELIALLDDIASIITNRTTTFAKYIKEKLKLNIETNDTEELLKNREFKRLKIVKEIITKEKNFNEKIVEIKEKVKNIAKSSILELILKDYTIDEYKLMKESFINTSDLFINLLKDNHIFEISFDKDGSFNKGVIEFQYDFTNFLKDQLFNQIIDEELKVDINIKLASEKSFNFKTNRFDEDKELVNDLRFKMEEINFKPINIKNCIVEPEFKYGILDGFYLFIPTEYDLGMSITYYPINIGNISYTLDCDCIIINFDYPARTVYTASFLNPLNEPFEEKYYFAKRAYNSVDFIKGFTNQQNKYTLSYNDTTSKSIIYYPKTNEIDFNIYEKNTLHNFTLDKDSSIYNYNCEMKSYDVYTCSKCDKQYIVEGKTLHENKLLGKVNLEYYGIYEYKMEFWGCDICNRLYYLPSLEYTGNSSPFLIDLKTSSEEIDGVKIKNFDFYNYKKKVLSIVYEYSDDELVIYVNFNKETNVGDKIFRFSGIISK